MTTEPRIIDVNPVIPAKAMAATLAFRLCLHLQAMAPDQDDAMPLLRIRVENIDPLYEECRARGVIGPHGHLEAKPWGSRD